MSPMYDGRCAQCVNAVIEDFGLLKRGGDWEMRGDSNFLHWVSNSKPVCQEEQNASPRL